MESLGVIGIDGNTQARWQAELRVLLKLADTAK